MVFFCDRSFFLFYRLLSNAGVPAIFFLLGISSCHSPSAVRLNHSTYFDRVLSKADSIDPDHKEEAFAFLDSVYGAFPNPGPEDLYKKYDFKRHYFYETRKDYPKAMLYVDSQLWIMRKNFVGVSGADGYGDSNGTGGSGDRESMKDYGKAFFAKGDVLMAERKLNDAFLNYYQGMRIIEKTEDTCAFGEYAGRLGLICYQQARYREAVAYFREAFENLSHCTDKEAFTKFVYQQGHLDNIALCYAKSGMEDSAMFYYDSALRYIRENGRAFQYSGSHSRFIETAEGVIYGNQADAWYKKGDTAMAENLYRESIRINSQKEHADEDAQFTRIKLVGLYLAGRRFAEAREELAQLRSVLDSLPDKDVELHWLQLLSRYNDSTGQTRAAYGALQAYLGLKDSLDAGNKPADVNGELQHIAHEYELNLLKKRDELKTIYLIIAVLFAVMATIIIFLVWKYWERSRKNVAVLTLLNQRIRNQYDHTQKALTALEQSQQENTRMMKIVAHDLRNPIGASGSIAALLLKKPDLPKDQKKMLELIKASSENSLDLIEDLLHVNTIAEEMTKEPVDIPSVLEYCVNLLQYKAEDKKQRIILKTKPVIISANREKIWRVLSNLITNAIKFSPARTDIVVNLYLKGGNVIITVKDQGIGIPDNLKEKIFDLFTEAKRRGTSGEESFGMGLSISRQIIQAHGGKIWYESEPGEGAIFYVELPAL
jgi:signal transduction histidine kinase